MNFYPTLVCS